MNYVVTQYTISLSLPPAREQKLSMGIEGFTDVIDGFDGLSRLQKTVRF